ncbi:MAG TPA: two-component regulator propeller domain-containing protein, partial [Chitinophaga sp.]|uniref:ligand-binding sensor domain-containing protein n=1 Tax=Chitinophaga sp. TaxID=1869181 RepID=UPI002B879137
MLCRGGSLSAQTYNYAQYKIEQGLAGNIVYRMGQDRDGFMWFATETGVSRFDGTSFRNYTTADGLPDNETLRMFIDTKGRVWFMPFANRISYYYKGKIHNQENDTILRKMAFTSMIHSVVEDKDHNVLFASGRELYVLTGDEKLIFYKDARQFSSPVYDAVLDSSGHFNIRIDTRTYHLNKEGLVCYADFEHTGTLDRVIKGPVIYLTMRNSFRMSSGKLLRELKLPTINNFTVLNDSIVYLNTSTGVLVFNTQRWEVVERLLPGQNVSNCYVDSEGNTWFSTLNDGVFRLYSRQFKCIRYTDKGSRLSVYSLWNDKNELLIGTDNACLKWSLNGGSQISKEVPEHFDKHVSFVRKIPNGLLLASGERLYFRNTAGHVSRIELNNSIKQVDVSREGNILAATSFGMSLVNIHHLSDPKNIYHGRTTTVHINGDSVYFGTLQGLYSMNHDYVPAFLSGLYPALRNRIAAICTGADSTRWIATGGEGIVGIKQGRILYHFNTSNGLSSNDSRCMALDEDGSLWVGSDRGLDRVQLRNNGAARISNFSTSNGLVNGLVNAVVIKGDTVFVGTPEGLSLFNKKEMAFSSYCNLRMLSITSNEQPITVAELSKLKYKNNRLRFDFAAISFKSEGDIRYFYRLTGQDTAWKMITQRF